MGVELTVTDSGATGLELRLDELSQEFTFGIHEDAKDYDDGTVVAEVGSVHEWGGVNMPRRSFLRGYVDSGGSTELGSVVQSQVGAVVDGAQPSTVSTKAGKVAVDGVRKRMASGIVGESHKDYKGKTAGTVRELKQSGHLRDSIAAKPVES